MRKRSPSELFHAGGGVANERVAQILALADESHHRREMSYEDRRAESDRRAAADAELRDQFLTHCRPASGDDYRTWLAGFLKACGQPTHMYNYDFPGRSWQVLEASGKVLPNLCGAQSLHVIVPAGMDLYTMGGNSHNSVYFMDGFQHVGMWVPTYRDVP